MSSSEDVTRKKKASFLLALLLLVAAVVLTIINLDPGTRRPEGKAPIDASPNLMPSSLPSSTSSSPSPASSNASSASSNASSGGGGSGAGPSGGSGVPECVVEGSGLACPKNFTIAGNTAGLFPGGTVQLPLTIENPNEEAIRVTTIKVSVTGTSASSCSTSNLGATDYAGSGFVVPGKDSGSLSLALTMSRAAPDACQSVTFTLSFAGEAEPA